MAKRKFFTPSNLIFLGILALFIIPPSRTFLQVQWNSLLMKLSQPDSITPSKQQSLPAFDYALTDIEGMPVPEKIGQGTPTFISYWATWCPPCIAELPSIAELHETYEGRVNFALITFEDPAVVKQFLDKKKLDLPVRFPRQETPELLSQRSIPTNYIIDGNGTIVVKEQGAQNWNSEVVHTFLDALLDKSTP